MSKAVGQAFLEVASFEDTTHVVDVGGNKGELITSILRRHPHLKGSVFDLPQIAEQVVVPADLEGRVTVEAGDFFKSVTPTGADCYILKHIIHDWGDDLCITILRNIRAAMAPNGRVLVVEMVLPNEVAPNPGYMMDLNMLGMHNLKE